MGGANPMGGKGGPAAPDFNAAAEKQAASGHIDQSNPFGSTGWRQTPDGRWTQSTSLAGGLGQGAANLMGQIGSQGALGTGDDARRAATSAYYDRAASRLDPQWSQAAESQKAQMANSGLDPGSEAYDNAAGNFSRARNDAYAGAERDAQTAGNQAQALTFEQNRESQMQPYQQLGAMAGLTSGLSGQGQQTQYMPAAMAGYQGALQSYGIDQQGKNSMMGGLAGMGGTLGAARMLGPAAAAAGPAAPLAAGVLV